MFYYTVPASDDVSSFCLVSDRFLCVLGPDATHGYVMSLWAVLQDDGSRLEDVLTFFAGGGIAKLPAFALVELVDVPTGSVALAVRGDAQVEILGRESEPYLGAGAATWVEGAAQSVDRLSIGFRGAATDASELPLHRGIVRSDRLVWRTPLGDSDAIADDEYTEVPAWAREAPNPEPAVSQTASIDRSEFDDDEHTIMMASRSATTQIDEELDETIVSSIRRPAPHLTLSLPDGTAVDLTRTVVVGRRPKSQPGKNARLVTVASPTNEVSGTHVEFSLSGDSVLVTDSNSTNGSIIRIPNKEPYVLKSGESVAVPVGSAVDIGDSNLVTVRRG